MHARSGRVLTAVLAAAAFAIVTAQAARQAGTGQAVSARDWPTYGHDSSSMRFSPLTEITPANVDQLKVAWIYHMKPAAPAASGGATAPGAAPSQGRGRGGSGFSASEVTPIVAASTMYLSTPYSRVVAVDPAGGTEIWAFQLSSGSPSTRGVEYWPGDGQTPPQIVFGSSDGKLYSLDARTGKPNEVF